MFFMDSDNNLEQPQMENILAAARVGGNADVRIIMLVDRSTKGDADDGYTSADVLNFKNWSGAKIFEVKRGSLVEIENLGDYNMGDPANLVKFVEKASSIAPAEKYGLVFGDHGASWPGFNGDGSHHEDSITLAELQDALKGVTEKVGKLELIHYDDCLMSCVENATAVAPYTKWLTASAELVPGEGCDYDTLLKGLLANPTMDGKGLGSLVVSSFRDFYEKADDPSRKSAAPGITMALIDCEQVPNLEAAMNDLGSKASAALKSGGREAFLKAAGARAKVTEYGRGSGEDAGAGVVDVVDLCRLLQKQFGPSTVGTSAEAVITQVKKTVVTYINGKGLPQSRGLSVFLPLNTQDLTGPGNTYANTQFAGKTGWDKLVATYNGVQSTDKTDPVLAEVKASATSLKPDAEVTFTSKLTADDLDEAYFTLAMAVGDNRIILGQLPAAVGEGGNLSEAWDGQWLYIHNGKEQMVCPIDDIQLLDEDDPDSDIVALVPLQVRQGGKGEWIDLTVTFLLDISDDEGVTGEVIYAFEENEQGRREVDLEKGDIIRPVFLVIDKNGEEGYDAGEGEEFELKITAEGLSIAEDRVPSGDYFMGFRAIDLAGNGAEEFIKIAVSG